MKTPIANLGSNQQPFPNERKSAQSKAVDAFMDEHANQGARMLFLLSEVSQLGGYFKRAWAALVKLPTATKRQLGQWLAKEKTS